jgi:hypothetical protein
LGEGLLVGSPKFVVQSLTRTDLGKGLLVGSPEFVVQSLSSEFDVRTFGERSSCENDVDNMIQSVLPGFFG